MKIGVFALFFSCLAWLQSTPPTKPPPVEDSVEILGFFALWERVLLHRKITLAVCSTWNIAHSGGPYGPLFHVEHSSPLWQPRNIAAQRRHPELCWNHAHGRHQQRKVLAIKFRRWVVEQKR